MGILFTDDMELVATFAKNLQAMQSTIIYILIAYLTSGERIKSDRHGSSRSWYRMFVWTTTDIFGIRHLNHLKKYCVWRCGNSTNTSPSILCTD
jgi:hypothetical protein